MRSALSVSACMHASVYLPPPSFPRVVCGPIPRGPSWDVDNPPLPAELRVFHICSSPWMRRVAQPYEAVTFLATSSVLQKEQPSQCSAKKGMWPSIGLLDEQVHAEHHESQRELTPVQYTLW